ncbi:hypothetical protein [Streptomyces yangpuensis]
MAERTQASEAWTRLNERQRAFLLAIDGASRTADADADGWVPFSLDPVPSSGGPVTVLEGLRTAGWSTRGVRSTLRGLLDRSLIDTWYGLVRLPDGRLADRVRTRALDLGREAARTGRAGIRPQRDRNSDTNRGRGRGRSGAQGEP